MAEGLQIRPVMMNGSGDTGHAEDGDEHGGFMRLHRLSELSPEVRKRVAALRKLQLDSLNVEVDFYKALHALEVDFQKRFAGIHSRRRQIVTGESEPTNEEAEFPLFNPGEDELVEEFQQMCVANDKGKEKSEKGVPNFWLEVLKNMELISDMIQDNDEDVLKSLIDITLHIDADPMSFTLSFHFAPNEYFTNSVLTKKYFMKCEIDPREPADFDGQEIFKCEGCKIDWKEKKDITKKLIKKKQKNKKNPNAGARFITKEVKADSFFNYFDPPEHTGTEDDQNMEENESMLLHMDFEIGQAMRDTIVPHALFHFSGETCEEDDDDFEDEDFDDEDGEDDDEDDEDEE